MQLFLGIDIGTGGCRACIADAGGTVHAGAHAKLPPPRRTGSRSEQDPWLWWQALESVLDRLRPRLRDVGAICIDGTSATLLLSDASGNPVTPALMYNDARATAHAARIARQAPPDSAARGASSALAKLLWLLDTAAAARATHALHQADWLCGRLCGRFDLCDENNALKLGYDVIRRRWPGWLAALQLPDGLLPTVVPAGQAVGTLQPAWRQRWGFPESTRLISGTTDSTASFLATGAGSGDGVTALGSTLVIKLLSSTPVFDARHGIYSHRLGQHWLAGGASNSGGAVLLRYFSSAELHRLTPALQPDKPTGLDYYPLLEPGERFPVCDPALPPRLTPRPADAVRFLQGMLEGMAAIEARGYEQLARLGAGYPQRVLTTGGGAVNAAWCQIRSSALGVPVLRADEVRAACGSAKLATCPFTAN